jgi:hypothetical protein
MQAGGRLAGGRRTGTVEQFGQVGDAKCTPNVLAGYTSVSLPFQADVFPLGFLLRVKSNHRSVIEIARDSWSCFTPKFSAQPLELDVIVSPRGGIPPEVIFRAQSNLLAVIGDADNSALCDLKTGFGFAYLSEAAVGDQSYFRFNFLEAIIYTLLDARHVVAVHAACVAKDGNGFLLFGDSGAGKSSLAYACARRGWTYVSDDCAFILRCAPGRVAIGNPRIFRFRPPASSLFPEIQGAASLRNGKPTIEIKSAILPSIKTETACTINQIIFLNRCFHRSLPAAVLSISQQECWRRISQQNAWPSELDIVLERQDALKDLLNARALQLNYTHCAQAVDALEQVARLDAA